MRIDITGKTYGRLTVLSFYGISRWEQALWMCLCSCGRKLTVAGYSLRNGHTASCGCLQKERASEASTTHGHTKNRQPSPEYQTWCSMLRRCYNPEARDYARYGGRGIKVCRRW